MELIERYLQAVKFALPPEQRDDIIKELRDNMLSQVEEKEAELGHPLNEDEQVELLKKLGSPMRLASRYRKQQQMIGATMFPIYWKVLKASLALAFLVLAAASIATAAAGKTLMESLGVLFRYPSVALMVFAWITLAFSALEFFGARLRLKDTWDPRKLPPLVKQSPRKSRFELIAQLLVQTIFGVWWLAGLHYQYLIFGPGIAFLRFGPVWQTIYPLFVVMVLVDVTLTAAMLVWPQWTQGRRVSRLVMSALGLVVLYFLINAPDLFVAADSITPQLQALAKGTNYGVHLGLGIAAMVNVVNIGIESVRFVGRRLGSVHQATVS
ncbi:MAG: HAAS signaling domain-containing protein [Terriglobales bacterium]